ncbi:putative GNAT family acetyltransferase [Streptosporangium becharense]|uniref:Putative GNAT family acetyltransferase n=1 Tax=Streptosporangium becharense TaxID=1816182 RepID=A0A7W9MHF6_9ACTN|nr:GNAT family N-acetyltransferase [Streptosporangium becharense]MBB2913407.1 putative GNAT family acetyltransferase [Streptosporangium becharense]MBB5821097.1 putative GNAT family acetyltransferase [Streptosporangium becharense]
MADNDIKVSDDPGASRFEILVDGGLAGFAEYRLRAGKIIFTHTEIDPAFEGRGLGSRLASGALDASRSAGRSVVPLCPFIAGYIRRHPEYRDLVPDNYADLLQEEAS